MSRQTSVSPVLTFLVNYREYRGFAAAVCAAPREIPALISAAPETASPLDRIVIRPGIEDLHRA
jgi:hypothetical protein